MLEGFVFKITATQTVVLFQNLDVYSDEQYIEMVDINDGECVVSSGDYQRFYEVDGVRYCHIIDPDTLYPSDEFAAVSVITDDSGKADSYSTALYTMSLDEGMAFVKERDNVEAMWVMHDGEKIYSDNNLILKYNINSKILHIIKVIT